MQIRIGLMNRFQQFMRKTIYKRRYTIIFNIQKIIGLVRIMSSALDVPAIILGS